MNNKLNIAEEVLNKLITNVFNIQCEHNSEHIKEIILSKLPDHSKELILHLACVGKKYEPVFPGDYVKVKPPDWHKGDKDGFEWDVLTDMNLHPGGGYVFGKVIKDASYKNQESYDPFYQRITVELMYHDKERQYKGVEHDFAPVDLIKVREEDIKYFDIVHELDA